jgi:uncharacterized phiE125 gp8 family phage protein
MMLKELGVVPVAALPLAALRAHLRLPEGAPPGPHDAAEAAGLEQALRAALAAIEARTGKALIARAFELRLNAWRGDGCAQVLPVAPVAAITAFAMRDAGGGLTPVEAARWRLEEDMHRPRLVAAGYLLPDIPAGGRAEVTFTAGFGPDWADLPGDLQQAALMLAAQYWEERHAGASHAAPAVRAVLPFGVAALVERWRLLRGPGGRA